MSVTKLRQKRDGLVEKAAKANEAASDDANAEVREDLLKEFDDCMAEIEQLDKDIARAERVESLLNERQEPATPSNQQNIGNQEPQRKVVIPANARRHDVQNFRNEEIHGMTGEERAYAFGRFLLANAARTVPGKYSHLNGYIQKHQDAFGPMAAATEGGNAGVFVPDEFGTDLISNMKRYGVARNLCNVLSMSSDKRTDPKEGSDPTPTFVGEGVEGTDITPTDDSTVTLTAKKLMGILINSSELNEDAISEFGDSMMRRLANGFAKKEDDCLFLGDGTSTYGGMIGINTKLQDVDGAGTDSSGLITAAGNLFSEFTMANFEEVVGTLPDLSVAASDLRWVCHRLFYYTVMVRLELALGGVTASEAVNGLNTPLFLGYPVTFSNSMPSTDSNSQVAALFGDFRRAVNFGDRRMYTLAFSDQATVGSVNLWSSDQIGTKATQRFDIAVHSVGDASNPGPVVGLQSAAS